MPCTACRWIVIRAVSMSPIDPAHESKSSNENGKFLDQFRTGKPTTPHVLFLSADKYLWIADIETSKILKYDPEGHFLYSWGSSGQWPGAMWNVQGMSVDQEGISILRK